MLTSNKRAMPSDQEHVLTHYHSDTFCFFPSEEERTRRGLFYYSPAAWLLHFERDRTGQVDSIVWNLDDQSPEGEVFVKEKSGHIE